MGKYVEGSVWFYRPDRIAPPIFAALYAISGCIHAYQTHRYKSWKMTMFLPWGAFLMVTGFVLREVGAYHDQSLAVLIASTVFVLSGPPVYAGADYFMLGRTLYYIPWLSPVNPGRVVQTFVAVDVIVEALIARGAAMMANSSDSDSERKVGQTLVKVSLLLQAIVFGFYFALLAVWHVRVRRAGLLTPSLRTMVRVLYTSASLITIRCVYRIVEFFEGYDGELYTNEVYFWVFEASLMLINSFLINVFHPGKYFPQKSKVYLATDGKTEVRGPGWSDSRPWYMAFIDPFNIQGWVRKALGKGENERFWESGIAGGLEEDVEGAESFSGETKTHDGKNLTSNGGPQCG